MNSFVRRVIGRSRKGDAEQRREVALVCLALPWGRAGFLHSFVCRGEVSLASWFADRRGSLDTYLLRESLASWLVEGGSLHLDLLEGRYFFLASERGGSLLIWRRGNKITCFLACRGKEVTCLFV